MVGSGSAMHCDRDGDNQYCDDVIKFRVPTLRSVFACYLGIYYFRFCTLGPRLFLWMALSVWRDARNPSRISGLAWIKAVSAA